MHALTWVAASPDGTHLCVGSETGRLTLYDLVNARAAHTFESGEFIARIRWTSDGQRLVAATLDDHVLVRSGDLRERLGEMTAGHGRLRDLAIRPEGDAWATCGEDGLVRVWDAQSLAPIHVLKDGEVAASAVGFARDTMVAGYVDGYFTSWRYGDWERRACGAVVRHPPVYSLGVSPDGERVVFGGGKGGMQEVIVGRPPDDWIGGQGWKDTPPRPIAVNAIDFAPDGAFVAACSDDTAQFFENTRDILGKSLGSPFYYRDPKPEWTQDFIVSGACFIPGTDRIATSHFDGNLRLWERGLLGRLLATVALGS